MVLINKPKYIHSFLLN